MTGAKVAVMVLLAIPFSPLLLLGAYGIKRWRDRKQRSVTVDMRTCVCGRTSIEPWESYLKHMKRCRRRNDALAS